MKNMRSKFAWAGAVCVIGFCGSLLAGCGSKPEADSQATPGGKMTKEEWIKQNHPGQAPASTPKSPAATAPSGPPK